MTKIDIWARKTGTSALPGASDQVVARELIFFLTWVCVFVCVGVGVCVCALSVYN